MYINLNKFPNTLKQHMITYHASWSFPEQIAMVTKARKINLQELLRN